MGMNIAYLAQNETMYKKDLALLYTLRYSVFNKECDMKTILATVLTKRGNSFDILLPAKRVVCPACDGNGTELRGGLKGAVISDENLADPDFCESYFGGDYDVACSECKGLRVVDEVDVEKLSPKMAERYWRAVDEAAASDREYAAEQRWFSRGME